MFGDTVYYEVTGGEPLMFCRDWRERTKAVEAAYLDYAESKGGIGNTRYVGDSFGGVIFAGDAPLGWKRHRKPCRDGTPFWQPVKRGPGATEGKAFQAEIDALPKLPSPDEFCGRFGFPQSVDYHRDGSSGFATVSQGWRTTQIAWTDAGDSFWITLPDFDKRIKTLQEKGYVVSPDSWSLPDGMKRSSRARYELAMAAAKVAEEEAA